tara:strand:- start:21578 stop:23491 length:1914 start_codon:yes stop_codon:yes gene_type:complete
MLQFLRSGLSSFLTMVLLGLLVASFALWGIGRDIFATSSNIVAEVGDQKISAQDFAREFQVAYQQQQQRLGGELTRSMAISLGLGQQTLVNQVNRTAFIEAARQMGLRITDEQLREFIYDLDVFKNDFGQFQKYYFELAARNQGLDPKELEELLREDLLRQEFLTTLVGPLTLPRPMLESIYKFERETRTAEMLIVSASTITDIESPTEEQLKAYYDEHSYQYMAPEYRKLAYISIKPEQYMDDIAVPEDELKEEYNLRQGEYSEAETRDIRQIVLDSQEAAAAAYQDLKAGKSFVDVLSTHSDLSEADSRIGEQSRTDLEETYGPEVAEAVFALDEGGFTSPQETAFGWYIFEVRKIQEGSAKAFEEVRAELEKELKRQHALDKVYEVTNKVEDELAGGVPLTEIAETLNLTLVNIGPTDSNGFAPTGQPVQNLPGFDGFLARAFEQDPGTEPVLEESSGDVFYVLNVTDVQPSQLRPFEEVRGAVEEAWIREDRNRKAEELASRLKADVESGKKLKDLAAAYDSATYQQVTIARNDQSGTLSTDLHQAIFTTAPGALELKPAASNDGYVLFQVTARDFPDDIPENLDQLAENIIGIYQSEVLSAYRNYLTEALPVKINERTAKAVLDQMSASEEQ